MSLPIDHKKYLERFGDISKLHRRILFREMDRVWDELGLDNARPLSSQTDKVAAFYSHPVWVLNGLFSELDKVSRAHRKAIARYVSTLPVRRVADYGGGSGVLAEFITEASSSIDVEIVEPYPFEFFLQRRKNVPRVRYVPALAPPYDLVIAQDVLEHVDEPERLILTLVETVRPNGYLIFANCFYPEIKCHLPSTFYLRHQFKSLVSHVGLEFVRAVPGAEHAQAFSKTGEIDYAKFLKANEKARSYGLLINRAWAIPSKLGRLLRRGLGTCV